MSLRGQNRRCHQQLSIAGLPSTAELLTNSPRLRSVPKLVPRRVPVRRQTHYRAIAKHVVLAIDEAQFMAEIEISRIEPAPRSGIGVHTGFPLATLYQHRCVRDQRVAADMIEMKMRVDDEVDLAGISVDRFEPRTDFFARLKADAEKPREPRAEPSSGVVLAVRVQPGVE